MLGSFHNEHCELGNNRTLTAGDVLLHPTIRPWGAHVILGFAHDGPDMQVLLARPYAYASCVGSSGPNLLHGSERYSLPVSHVVDWVRLGGGFRT